MPAVAPDCRAHAVQPFAVPCRAFAFVQCSYLPSLSSRFAVRRHGRHRVDRPTRARAVPHLDASLGESPRHPTAQQRQQQSSSVSSSSSSSSFIISSVSPSSSSYRHHRRHTPAPSDLTWDIPRTYIVTHPVVGRTSGRRHVVVVVGQTRGSGRDVGSVGPGPGSVRRRRAQARRQTSGQVRSGSGAQAPGRVRPGRQAAGLAGAWDRRQGVHQSSSSVRPSSVRHPLHLSHPVVRAQTGPSPIIITIIHP